MELRADILIQGVIKSLADVVIPALDPNNKLAQEQSRLALGTLQVVLRHLPMQFRYDQLELGKLIGLADALCLAKGAAGGPIRALTAQCDAARDVLTRAKTDPAELNDTVHSLRAAIGSFVDDAHAEGGTPYATLIRKIVLEAAREGVDRERSWVLPFGFEADPNAIRPIDALLPPARGS